LWKAFSLVRRIVGCIGSPLYLVKGLLIPPNQRFVLEDASTQGPAAVELTILMPCLDEAKTVGSCIGRARGFMERAGVQGEVLVVDNGSTDGSRRIAAEAGARVVLEERRGYGAALLRGIREAEGQYVIMGDADLSYDFSSLDAFLYSLRAGNELVIGNRFAGGIAPGAMPFLHRYLGNPLLSWLARLFYRSPVRDFHCGLRGVARDSALRLNLRSTGMEFASEMVVRATLEGQRIEEVATTLFPDGRGRPPHLRRWRDGWRHVRFLLLLSPRWLFLYPGMTLMAVGLVAMIRLLVGPVHLGAVGLDVNTLAYAGTAVVSGFQALSFALIAQTYAAQSGLMPVDRWTSRLRHRLSLEVGILSGLGLTVLGLIGGTAAVWWWGTRQFGPLDPQVGMRIVIPSATAVVLGMQVIFTSFFLSLLEFRERDSSL
jgi:glycosyltransferase involved in cell wall biosynthesis